jgi:hypothetical protein
MLDWLAGLRDSPTEEAQVKSERIFSPQRELVKEKGVNAFAGNINCIPTYLPD